MQTLKTFGLKYVVISGILVSAFVLLMGFKNSENTHKPISHTVTIFKMKYNPEHLVVNKGDTVVWINKDFYQHDVTDFPAKKWTSKPFNKGETWSKVITEDTDYFCNLHKVMKGTIRLVK
ncbi:MAG TPA: plastocyanin/azurin family copper-binding protein [Gelidibacter sp.]|uniref:plastocyanin/azurin family copper-binding protein n=1 Tax=Gelidibacter sp. TaxID=2018083 RepID=UPI002C51E04E|nr:plastocyanin/azurin family copper-binding protein [Gelidibacter sp.]HXJ98868.1 plastocyanin/azurin family copper-binding protein [Gelidibacter sp.]